VVAGEAGLNVEPVQTEPSPAAERGPQPPDQHWVETETGGMGTQERSTGSSAS